MNIDAIWRQILTRSSQFIVLLLGVLVLSRSHLWSSLFLVFPSWSSIVKDAISTQWQVVNECFVPKTTEVLYNGTQRSWNQVSEVIVKVEVKQVIWMFNTQSNWLALLSWRSTLFAKWWCVCTDSYKWLHIIFYCSSKLFCAWDPENREPKTVLMLQINVNLILDYITYKLLWVQMMTVCTCTQSEWSEGADTLCNIACNIAAGSTSNVHLARKSDAK